MQSYTVISGWDNHFRGDIRFPEITHVEARSHHSAVKQVCGDAFPERLRSRKPNRRWYSQAMPQRVFLTYRTN